MVLDCINSHIVNTMVTEFAEEDAVIGVQILRKLFNSLFRSHSQHLSRAPSPLSGLSHRFASFCLSAKKEQLQFFLSSMHELLSHPEKPACAYNCKFRFKDPFPRVPSVFRGNGKSLDLHIERPCRTCSAEHQNKPPKSANHPWMLPEKPWSRVHVDHAINFNGTNC